MDKWVCLLFGGIAGTASRYALTGYIVQRFGSGFPWGTMAVNVTGCLVVGFLDVVLERKFLLTPQWRLLLVTGFCGAFTTFSALILETSDLVKNGNFLYALGNLFLSLVIGLAAFKLGTVIAEYL
jgi:CrcB protein